METPTLNISTETGLTETQIVAEYIVLKEERCRKEFPDGGFGWSQSILTKIDNRMNYLRDRIVDSVCEKFGGGNAAE